MMSLAAQNSHERRQARVRIWVTVCHASDCRLPPAPAATGGGGEKALVLRIVIQNLGAGTVHVPLTAGSGAAAAGIRLRLKGGAELRPADGPSGRARPRALARSGAAGAPLRALTRSAGAAAAAAPVPGGVGAAGLALGPLDAAVVGDCAFALPADADAGFEPEGLECCAALLVPLVLAPPAAGPGRPAGRPAVEVEAAAEFDEARVWRHYARLAGGFWSFSEV